MRCCFADELITGFQRGSEAYLAIADLCHKHVFSEAC